MKRDFLILLLVAALLSVGLVFFQQDDEYVIVRRQNRRSNLHATSPDKSIASELEKQIIDFAFPDIAKSKVVDEEICGGGVLNDCIMSSAYGLRRHPIFKTELFHHGIDLAAIKGTPIIAPADGVVKFAGLRGGYGLSVTVDHGYGWVSRYAHLDKVTVKKGSYVKRGDAIGEVGSTGISTGPHLHFEVRYGGSYVDPRVYYSTLNSFNSLLAWKKKVSSNYSRF